MPELQNDMVKWIGLCAGEIWRYLDKHEGRASVGDIISGIEAPRHTIIMALGWLAREGHVRVLGELSNLSAEL